jgi:site-specific DNA-methyltransferase (cytosine-N4-specific)
VTTKLFKGAHFATFPLELIEPCTRSSSRYGDPVLDPFMGAGTTDLVAQKWGRRALGVELNKGYADFARNRIANPPEAHSPDPGVAELVG